MKRYIVAGAVALCGPPLLAQELLWEVNTAGIMYAGSASHFGDFNQDGSDDLLSLVYLNPNTQQQTQTLRIQSGVDGSILADRPPPFLLIELEGVGDFDLDGHPDYAIAWDTQGLGINYVEVWSPHRQAQLLLLSGTRSSMFGTAVAGRVDLNGDGLPDLVVASLHPTASDVRAYDHSGALLYTIPATQNGRLVLDVAGLGDVDGDACSEFLIGGTDYNLGYTRGFLAVVSGRTGTIIRLQFDSVQGDIIGFPIATVGDMDRDGVLDYASGNAWGGSTNGRRLLTVYSGATGAVIRQWQVAGYILASKIIGGRDADLDGVVDMICGSARYPNEPFREGRVQVFSSRDQQVLLHTEPPMLNDRRYPDTLTDLGVQPSSPYPVFALTYEPYAGPGATHLQVWRCTPPGAQADGTSCSSLGLAPTVGVRRVSSTSSEQSRLVLGSAPAGALAWCFAAAAGPASIDGIPLPLALAPLGFPGCTLYVPPTFSDTRMVGVIGFDRGYAAVELPLRLSPNGFAAAAQWLVLDFATGTFAATQRSQFHVQ